MIAEMEAATRALGERARLATVAVRSESGGGSGIRWSADRVITCAHCIREPHARVDVDGRTYDAEVERFDASSDVAVLKLATTGSAGASAFGVTPRDSSTLKPGELVFAFGHPLGTRDVLVHGVVRRASERLVVSDVPLAPGNSGGPLFDAAGRLVGMNSAIARDRSFSVATETIERVRRGDRERRLGIAVAPARSRAAGRHAGLVLVITAIEPGSDAERSALALGDAILAIDGTAVAAGATAAVAALRASSRLTIIRSGRTFDLALRRSTPHPAPGPDSAAA